MYILYKVVKHKTDIRGYWLDNEGKIYKDSITLIRYKTRSGLYRGITRLFKTGEKAVFYKEVVLPYDKGNRAYIIDRTGKIDVLSHRIELSRAILLSQEVKDLLARYKGLTIFKKSSGFTIELWRT